MKDVGEGNNKPKISIIIPTYNVEKYIDQCLDTLQVQTFEDFEVICVDDGSDDRTAETIQKHIEKDKRIRLIEMQHCGLAGVMRNEGLKYAHGKYCLFLDGDDFFEQDMLRKTFEKAEEDQADICLFDARLYNERTKIYKKIDYIIQKDYLPEEIPFEGRSFPYIFNVTTGCPWSKLIRKRLIDEYQLQFMELHRSNDVYFIFMALALAKKITAVPEVFVNYRQSGDSLQANNAKSPWDWYEALKALKIKLEEMQIYEELRNSFRNLAFGVGIYNLCSLKSGDAFCMVYERMKGSFFEEFDLVDFKEEECYSYNAKKYEIYQNMMKCTAGEYLFLEVQKLKQEKSYWVTRAKNAEKENRNRTLKKRLSSLVHKAAKKFTQ